MLKNPYVDVFGHPGANCYRFDYERVVPLFKDSGKYIEFNASSVTFREGAAENMFTIAKLCKEHRVEVIVNTDAHSPFRVGEFEKATEDVYKRQVLALVAALSVAVGASNRLYEWLTAVVKGCFAPLTLALLPLLYVLYKRATNGGEKRRGGARGEAVH